MSRRRRRSQPRPPEKPALAETAPRSPWWHAWLPLIIVLAGAVVYANSLGGAFIFDDEAEIVQGKRLSFEHLDLVLGGYVPWRFQRPLVYLSLAANRAIGGLDPFGYHLFNVAVHIAAGLALFGVVRRTLLRPQLAKRWGASAPFVALAVALLWVVHPLQTQSVTYVIQRTESMMGLFYLLTLYCVIRSADAGGPRAWMACAIGACFLGMGCKSIMMTIIVTVLLYDVIFLGPSLGEAIRRRWVLYAGISCSYVLLLRIVTGVLSTSRAVTSVGLNAKGVTDAPYILTEPGVILHYLRLSLWPDVLVLDYDWPVVKTLTDAAPAGFVVLTLLGVTVWLLFRRPALGFVAAWFFIILAPTSSFMPISDVIFEHRMYLPLAGIVTLVVLGGHALLGWASQHLDVPPGKRRVIATALVCVSASVLGVRTLVRNGDYASAVTMWEKMVHQTPDKPRCWVNLGMALAGEDRYEEAIKAYDEALDREAEHFQALYNKGIALDKLDRDEEAIAAYRRAMAVAPKFSRAPYNLGQVLYAAKRYEEAIDAYRTCLKDHPHEVDVRIMLANSLAALGRHEEAIIEFELAAKSPDRLAKPILRARAYFNRGNSLVRLRRGDEALDSYRKAVAIYPAYLKAYIAIGMQLSSQGDTAGAAAAYRRVLDFDPNHAEALRALRRLERAE